MIAIDSDQHRLEEPSATLHQVVAGAIRQSPELGECIHRLARKYVWWKTPEEAVAQPKLLHATRPRV